MAVPWMRWRKVAKVVAQLVFGPAWAIATGIAPGDMPFWPGD